MTAHRISVFEVLDNFFGFQDCPEAERLNNAEIRELREHILDFYAAYGFPPRGEYETRLYLGGFLSSPPFWTEATPYVSSALLCSDSIVLFDPLHYWFCDEQYKRQRLMSAPVGWKRLQEKGPSPSPTKVLRPDYPLTRKYLAKAFTWLYSMRPLVDAGIVVLIPAEQIVYNQLATTSDLAKGIADRLEPVESLSETFSPEEITVDDNRKGLFVFAGGNREQQIQKWIGRGIEQFAKDVVVADVTGSVYTAPFGWEQHLGKASFNSFAMEEYQTTLIEGMRNLRLPILANLSPDVLMEIHRDSKYAEFRAGLSDTLRNIQAEIGSQDFVDQVAQIEKDILLPKVEAIYREIQSSRFRAATKSLEEGTFVFVQAFLGNLTTGVDIESSLISSTVVGGLSFLQEMFRRILKRDHRIWAHLLPEKPSLSVYYRPPLLKQNGSVGWEIDEQPSMRIKVARGLHKMEWFLAGENHGL